MRFLLRNITLYAFSLYLLQIIFSGVTINGNLLTYVLSGAILTLLYYTLKPILQLITFPINMATLGFFTVLINAFVLYITTVLLPAISISGFIYRGFSFLGFIVPQITFNSFFAYVICALMISCITTVISWLFSS